MGKSVIKASAVALALLLLPSLAVAAGLGKLTVFSGLGQPLKAEIALLAVQKDEANNLSVHLPPADAFRQANIEYAGALLSIKFNIEQRGEGQYVVELTSSQPINEPFLDMLVELDSKSSRLVREYTFLLDPPGYKEPQAAAAIRAPSVAAPGIKSVEMPKKVPAEVRAPAVEHPAAAAAHLPAPSRAPASKAAPKANKTYLVKRGDTLTKIANANRSGNVSLQQMLIALYRSNTAEFDGSNINRIRAGKILKIPDMATAAAVDQHEAIRMVAAQAADFNAYRRRLAAAVAAAPARAERRHQSASGKITAMGEEKPAPAQSAKDQLKVSRAEVPGKTGSLRSRQALQEELIAKEGALKEANERIAMLQKNVKDMQKLLELKSEAGAQLQQHAAGPGAVKAVEPAKTPVPAKKAEGAAPQAPVGQAAPPKAAAPKPPHKVAPHKAPHKAVARAPVPEPSLLDEILGNTLALYGGGGFLLLLFAGYGYYAWRRKKAQQLMQSSVIGAPGLATDSVFGAAGGTETGGAEVDTGGGEMQAASSPSADAAATEETEVDPIAEADVYMAYGRDTQAEEILKEALARDPSRQPIRAKLLEVYASRKDVKAFEAVAAEIHAATNGEGVEWEKALALGAQLDPENPLYSGKADAGAPQAVTGTQGVPAAEAVPDLVLDAGSVPQAPAPEAPAPEAPPGLDFDLGGGTMPGVAPQPEPAVEAGATKAASASADFDFDLDLGTEEKKAESAPGEQAATVAAAPVDAAATSIDFDFDLPGVDAAASPAEPVVAPPKTESAPPEQAAPAAAEAATAAPEAAAAESGGIDFDFNLDLPPQKEEAPSAPLDLSAISLDLGSPGEATPAPDAHWQEVATKLDLAKAYQEMGDKDGARELLDEVVKEGDAAQQEQAQTMIATLG